MKSRTNTALIAVAAGLMTLSALPVAAAAQQRPQPAPMQPQQHNGSPMQQHNTPQPQPYQSQNRPNQGSNHGSNNGPDNRYGNWNTSWGARPAGPPRNFTRSSDWYRHVRACQQRFRSYNPATDRYTVRRGQTAVCRL
jgi:predicted lipid-binding transport protein (Tim44 family)